MTTGFLKAILTLSLTAFAHEAHRTGSPTQEAKKADAKTELKITYDEVNSEYEKQVQPIFAAKCAACHSSLSESPWYSKIPGIHQIVESDRKEAKEHLEISKGFPFGGHGEPHEDLKAIDEVVTKGTMPTPLYSFMHPSSKLTQDEKEKILSWVKVSEAKLSALQTTEKKP